MTSVRKSLAISLANKYIQIALQLVSFFVLARLLTPEDIGLFAVASSAIGIAHIFREFGIGDYLIQEKELTEAKIATAFTITFLTGLILFSLLFITAPFIASFYNDERLIDVFRLLSINFLIIPFNATSFALIRRDMRFGSVFWIEILASITSTATAIILSGQGYGYHSLVWSSLANTLTSVIAVSFFMKGGLFHRFTLSEWKTVLSFGSQLTFANLTGQISTNANDLITGKFLGFSETAFISRAQGIMYLFHRDITATLRSVAFPAFANGQREGRDIEQDYIKAVTILTAFAWPFYGFFSLFPVEALRLFFGPQWDKAGSLVPLFCAGGASAATCSLIATLLPALGGVRYLLRLHLILDPLRIIAFITVTYYFRTAESFTKVFLIFFTLPVPLLYYFKDQVLKTNYRQLLVGLLQSTFVSLAALSIPACIAILHYNDANEILRHTHIDIHWVYKNSYQHYLREWLIIVIGIMMIPCWIIGIKAINHPINHEPIFKKYFQRKK